MTYVEKSLSQNERILLQGKIHWAVYLPTLFWLGLTILLALGSATGAATMTGLIGAFVALHATLYRSATEMAVTSIKVVSKRGLISRDTMEQRLSRIDSVTIQQGLFGRMFNYGAITVRGSGTSFTPIKFVDDPIAFKNIIERAIDFHERNGHSARAAAHTQMPQTAGYQPA